MIMNINQQLCISKIDLPQFPYESTKSFHLCFCFERLCFRCLQFSLKFKKNDTSLSLALPQRIAERFTIDGEIDFFLDGEGSFVIAAMFEIGECDILIIFISLVFDPCIAESLQISLSLQRRSRGTLAQSNPALHLPNNIILLQKNS